MKTYRAKYTKNGKNRRTDHYYMAFQDWQGKRQRIPLGVPFKESAEALAGRIIELNDCRKLNKPLDGKLRKWLEDCPADLRARLTVLGMISDQNLIAGKTLAQHVEDYCQWLLADNTAEHVRHIQQQLTWIFGGCGMKSWTEIEPTKILKFLTALRGEHQENKNLVAGLGVVALNHYIMALKCFANWMIETERATKNPVKMLQFWRVTDQDLKHKRRALSLEGFLTLLRGTEQQPHRCHMTGPERALLYRFAAETGLRQGEIRSLTVGNFDLKQLTVSVKPRSTKNRKGAEQSLRPDTAALLKKHLALKAPTARAFHLPHYSYMPGMLRLDLQATGIPYKTEEGVFDFHALRGQCATMMMLAGVPLPVVQKVMRHSTSRLTEKHYLKIAGREFTEAVAALPDLGQVPAALLGQANGTDAISCPGLAKLEEKAAHKGYGMARNGTGKTAIMTVKRDISQQTNILPLTDNLL